MSVYEEVTQSLIEQLEKGTVPWIKPWTTHIPYNAVSQKEYRGINVVLLWSQPYEQNAWLTYKQARELGGFVKKGEKATQITYASKAKKREVESEEEDDEYFFLKFYYVFNIEQCEELPERLYRKTEPKEPDYPHLARIVDRIGAEIRHGGNKAYYSHRDFIQLPNPHDFESESHYWATAFHELVHWTGAKPRLDRDLSGYFGGEDYAREELVAEMGAAFLCAHYQIEGELRHAGYINSWLNVLKQDKKAIFTAARHAQQAADYLREQANEREETEPCITGGAK